MTYDYPVPEQIEPNLDDPRIQAALAELRALILQRFPNATFSASRGEEPVFGIHLRPTVDVEDLDQVRDLVRPRLVDMQVEEGLPIYVFPAIPPDRLSEYLRRRREQEMQEAVS